MRTTIVNLTFMLLLTVTLSSSSKYSNILTQFIELNNVIGNPSEDVGVIISNVKNVLIEEEKNNEAHYSGLLTNCASGDSLINSALVKLANDVNDSKKNLNDWNTSLGSSGKDIAKAEDDIKTTSDKIGINKKQIEKELEDFKVSVTETDQKLTVVKVLRNIITDELINSHPGSFLQINKFTDKLNELKGMLNNDNDSLYSPLVSVLLELASEQNFSDQGMLKKILENISNLDKSLIEYRNKRQTDLNDALKNLRANSVNLAKIRHAYLNMRAQSLSKRIDAQHYIHFYTNEITHFNSETNRKNDEKQLLSKICDFEKDAYAKDKAALEGFKSKVVPFVLDQIQKIKQ